MSRTVISIIHQHYPIKYNNIISHRNEIFLPAMSTNNQSQGLSKHQFSYFVAYDLKNSLNEINPLKHPHEIDTVATSFIEQYAGHINL